VPADERLRQADLLDQIGHRGVAIGETLDDSEAVDVGQRLVDEPELTELVGLVDDGRDGRADAGRRGRQGWSPGRSSSYQRRFISTEVDAISTVERLSTAQPRPGPSAAGSIIVLTVNMDSSDDPVGSGA
jgi:hypothetical protein